MNYQKYLDYIAKDHLSTVDTYRRETLEHVKHDAETSQDVAISERMFLVVNSVPHQATTFEHFKTRKSTQFMPKFPSLSRFTQIEEQRHSGTEIVTKITKTSLKSLREYAKEIKAINDGLRVGGSAITDIIAVAQNDGKLNFSDSKQNSIFAIDVAGGIFEKATFDIHLMIKALEFVSEYQREAPDDIVTFYGLDYLHPLTFGTKNEAFIYGLAPVRTF